MKSIQEYIESGILEMYVLGHTTEEENLEIGKLYNTYAEVKNEIDLITNSVLQFSELDTEPLNPLMKTMLMAIIDYTERMKNGEPPSILAVLNENSKISDFSEWLEKPEMGLPADFTDFHARIIGFEPKINTSIVWIKDSTPYEVHDAEYEKFLIVEGSCDIVIENNVFSLVPGDYLSIPLNLGHVVKVTSQAPCKVILQRVAA